MMVPALTHECLEVIALKADSLTLAYVINSEFVAKRLCSVLATQAEFTRVLQQTERHVCRWIFTYSAVLTPTQRKWLLDDARRWQVEDKCAVFERLDENDWTLSETWELAWKLRRRRFPPEFLKSDEMRQAARNWLSKYGSPQRLALAAKWTGNDLCSHCPDFSSEDDCHKSCIATVALQKFLRWCEPLSPNLVIASFMVALSTIVTMKDPDSCKIRYGGNHIKNQFRLWEETRVYKDLDHNWVFVSDCYATEEQIRSNYNETMSIMKLAGIHSTLEFFSHPAYSSYIRGSGREIECFCKCRHCERGRKYQCAQGSVLRFHRPIIFVIRVQPLTLIDATDSTLVSGDAFGNVIEVEEWVELARLQRQILVTRERKGRLNEDLLDYFYGEEDYPDIIPAGLQWAAAFASQHV